MGDFKIPLFSKRQTMHKTQVCTYTQVERSIGLCCLDEITLLEMQSDHLPCHPGQKCTTVHSLGRTSGPKTPSQDGLESACVHTSFPGRRQVNPSAFLRPNLTVLSSGLSSLPWPDHCGWSGMHTDLSFNQRCPCIILSSGIGIYD